MKKIKGPSEEAAELRRRAEERLQTARAEHPPRTAHVPQRLLHELEVHRIELEMQNAELRLAREESEEMLERYTDLYDFAPVGYFTLDLDGSGVPHCGHRHNQAQAGGGGIAEIPGAPGGADQREDCSLAG